MKPILSICMMVKNEEANLHRCLKSLQPLRNAVSNELIVVDTGSEDATVDIARQYTNKVFFHPWNNHFSEMRNITIDYASGRWILIIDADEVLIQLGSLVEFFRTRHAAQIGGAAILVKNYTSLGNYTTLKSVRIFRNDGYFHYQGVVHNKPTFKGTVCEIAGVQLDHYGYLHDDKELMERKFQRTSTLLLTELEKNPDDLYYRYQLAVSYGMHDDWYDSMAEIQLAHQIMKRNQTDSKAFLYIYEQFSQTCLHTKNFQKAEVICREGLALEPDFFDLWYSLGHAQAMQEKHDDAIISFEHYLALVNNFDNLPISRNLLLNHYTLCKQSEAYYNLAILHWKQENWDQALVYLEAFLDQTTDITDNCIKLLAELAFKTGQFTRLYKIYQVLKDGCWQEQVRNLVTCIEANVDIQSSYYRPFVMLFAEIHDAYGELNALRYGFIESTDMTISLTAYIESYDLNSQSDWCGDVVYYSIHYGLAEQIFSRLSDANSVRYLQYLDAHYSQELVMWIKNRDCFYHVAFSAAKTNKILLKYLLFSGRLDEVEYAQYFKQYIASGIAYVEHLYNWQAFTDNLIYDVKSVEDAFLMQLALAQANGDNQELYVQYLKKALAIYPDMKQGVQVLLEEVLAATEENISEMALLKQALIKEIHCLLEQQKLDSARQVIAEAESIIGLDMELLAIKSSIGVNCH